MARRPLRVWRALRRRALRAYYRSQLQKPIDPDLAVFAAYWYRAFACNPRAIAEKLAELVPSAKVVWIIEAERAQELPAGVRHVQSGTRAYYRTIARAKYFVNNVNFPNDFVKREGTVHVQTHHGTPLKKMGLDLRGAHVAGKRMNFDRLMRRCERWDFSVTSNAFSTRMWARAYPTDYETLEVGYPRNDVLVNTAADEIARVRSSLGIGPEDRSVLYAPTHREYLQDYEPTLDLERVAADLGSGYVLLERAHYFYRDTAPQGDRGGRIFNVARHPSIEELSLAADVLVTDYSALMFDYAVLDRPIVIHAPDWETYSELRGTYFDLLAEPPGVVTRSEDELIEALRSGRAWGEEAGALRAAFRERFCALDDGRAAERVVRRVWLGEEPREAEPVPGRAEEPEIVGA